MALYELIFELPDIQFDVETFSLATSEAGYDAIIETQDQPNSFSVKIRHPNAEFEQGKEIGNDILAKLPSGSRFHSMRQALGIHEVTDSMLEEILAAKYGQTS